MASNLRVKEFIRQYDQSYKFFAFHAVSEVVIGVGRDLATVIDAGKRNKVPIKVYDRNANVVYPK